MKHIIYIHALFLKSFTLKYLSQKLKLILEEGHAQSSSSFFDYKSTRYNEDILVSLKNKIQSIHEKEPLSEIYLVGHSMGGLIGRLTMQKFPHLPVKALITLGTPHNGSQLAKHFTNTPFSFLLGNSGDSGILKTIPAWNQETQLYCIAGNYTGKIFTNVFLPHYTVDKHSDGTVFVNEAILDNSTQNIIINNVAHMQLIFSSEVADTLSKIILAT